MLTASSPGEPVLASCPLIFLLQLFLDIGLQCFDVIVGQQEGHLTCKI